MNSPANHQFTTSAKSLTSAKKNRSSSPAIEEKLPPAAFGGSCLGTIGSLLQSAVAAFLFSLGGPMGRYAAFRHLPTDEFHALRDRQGRPYACLKPQEGLRGRERKRQENKG